MASVSLAPELAFQQLGNQSTSLPTNRRLCATIQNTSIEESEPENQGLTKVSTLLNQSELGILDIVALTWGYKHKDGSPNRSHVLRYFAQGHLLSEVTVAKEEVRTLRQQLVEAKAKAQQMQQEKRELLGKKRMGRVPGNAKPRILIAPSIFVFIFFISTGASKSNLSDTRKKYHLKKARGLLIDAMKKIQRELCAETPEEAMKQVSTTR